MRIEMDTSAIKQALTPISLYVLCLVLKVLLLKKCDTNFTQALTPILLEASCLVSKVLCIEKSVILRKL
jgi:hypothetical protein